MILESKGGTCLSKLLIICAIFTAAQLEGAPAAEAAVHDQAAVRKAVVEEFSDVPEMIEIARCESKFRQYTDSGNPFYGGYGHQMIGVFQFYESVHNRTATTLGYDLTTLEGNIGYARYVYEMQGLTPWNSSRSCWESATVLELPFASFETVDITEKPTREELEAKLEQLRKIVALLTTLLELKGLS